jgi:hypothetical protein
MRCVSGLVAERPHMPERRSRRHRFRSVFYLRMAAVSVARQVDGIGGPLTLVVQEAGGSPKDASEIIGSSRSCRELTNPVGAHLSLGVDSASARSFGVFASRRVGRWKCGDGEFA